ncbi:hypothetical protein AVEN_1315-1 [Araneus ventricosus]|uniref:Uncharacterized protein n=1 Tax=Araneus ventricosus TaxID=182803 RepID=A0A4Y2D4V8_ARAVE|nr:hypothetical protein AVEN_1315-1 [Araneus ventricosus]
MFSVPAVCHSKVDCREIFTCARCAAENVMIACSVPHKKKLPVKLKRIQCEQFCRTGTCELGHRPQGLEVFGDKLKSPDLIALHPSEAEDEELQMSSDTTDPNTS